MALPLPRLAILSFSIGEYDARSQRVARSAIAAGYDVTMYARWTPGLPLVEQRDGYRLVRAPSDWRLAVPGLRGAALRRWDTVVATGTRAVAGGADQPTKHSMEAKTGSRTATSGPRTRSGGLRTVLRPASRALGAIPGVGPTLRRWRSVLLTFPLRPVGWAVALERVVEPAELWHGMWAGSLPAMVRLQRLHGGRSIYDSRDVYMLSREFYRLEWPLRSILAALERRWAHRVDRVITVNDAYAGLIARQLRVPRPPVVLNTPERWSPPIPLPDLIREALDLGPESAVVLYQGQLNTDRGIEQAADAVVTIPGAILALLGPGTREARYVGMTALPPYAGRVFRLPAVPPSELLPWTASADVMVMAIQPTSVNHQYTTPQKLWEALAAGVPVVASDLPGMADVVRETGAGYLCDPTDPASIAAALRQVLEAAPEEREALRRRALAAAHERYNWDTQAEILLGVYAGLLDGRRPAA